jgi:sugar lactone lactonase YvrE
MADTAELRSGLHFGEGPRHGPDGRLYYSDLYERAVFAIDLTTGEQTLVTSVTGQPSGLGWLPDGTLVVVSMKDSTVRRLEVNGVLGLHADLFEVATHLANDMVVDSEGRAYVGNLGFDMHKVIAEKGFATLLDPSWEAPGAALALVSPDGTVRAVAEDLKLPNGMVFLSDGTLIVAETLGFRLTAFDVAADGSLSNRRVWADLTGQSIAPDGLCVDAEDGVWVGTGLQAAAVRVVEGGLITDRVETSQICFAVALVGTTLVCCTAPTSSPEVVSTSHVAKLEVATVKIGDR